MTFLVQNVGLLGAESTQVSSEEECLMERKWASHGAGMMLTFLYLELGAGVLMGAEAIVTGSCMFRAILPLTFAECGWSTLFCFSPGLIVL